MTHLWIRSEQRGTERRVGITPGGAARLIKAGFRVSIERSTSRVIDLEGYHAAGCEVVAEHSWPDAPKEAIIFGLKELPADGRPLQHRHIMFAHAYRGQAAGAEVLKRFRAGGGELLDLEYLTDETGRRVAAFGYWAGYAGAAVSLMCLLAQLQGRELTALSAYTSADRLIADLKNRLGHRPPSAPPKVLIIGAAGRAGTGAYDFCATLGLPVTPWGRAESTKATEEAAGMEAGDSFPAVLAHDIVLNCVLAGNDTPVFLTPAAKTAPRRLRVLGDIACDPNNCFSAVRLHDQLTNWRHPAMRVHDTPPLDVIAIDNLPSLLPLEASQDFADQLLPSLLALRAPEGDIWQRARARFEHHSQEDLA